MVLDPEPIVYAYEAEDVGQKITAVRTCSDCCMECNPDGTPNLVGKIHRAALTVYRGTGVGAYSYLDCKSCTVFQGVSDKDWEQMKSEMDGLE